MPSAARLWLTDEFVGPQESFLRRRNLGRVFDDAGAGCEVDDFFPTFGRHIPPARHGRLDRFEGQIKNILVQLTWVREAMSPQSRLRGFRFSMKQRAAAG